MRKEKKDKNFINKPRYPGGLKALRAFISQNLQYPLHALENKIEGTVYLNYTIDHRGKVIDARVISSLGHGCDTEATRLVKLLHFEVLKNRGVKVKFHKNIQIHFRLPKSKPNSHARAYQIHYVSSSESKKEEKKGGGYTISIDF